MPKLCTTTRKAFVPEPMTIEESVRYIENLESQKFSYEEWEIARDLNMFKEFDRIIDICDPRKNE